MFESSGKSMMSQLSYRMPGKQQQQQSNVVSKTKNWQLCCERGVVDEEEGCTCFRPQVLIVQGDLKDGRHDTTPVPCQHRPANRQKGIKEVFLHCNV
jgi:hypothetical protein